MGYNIEHTIKDDTANGKKIDVSFSFLAAKGFLFAKDILYMRDGIMKAMNPDIVSIKRFMFIIRSPKYLMH